MKKIKTQQYLLQHGIKVDIHGRWLLHHIEIAEHPNGLEFLLELIKVEPINSIAITLQDNDGKTPLHYAAIYGNQDIVQHLIARMTEQSISAVDQFGHTALEYAHDHYHKEIFNMLLPNTMNGNSLFPLGYEPDFMKAFGIDDIADHTIEQLVYTISNAMYCNNDTNEEF